MMHFHEIRMKGLEKQGKRGKQGETKVSQAGGEELVVDLVGGLESYPTSKLYFVSIKCIPA